MSNVTRVVDRGPDGRTLPRDEWIVVELSEAMVTGLERVASYDRCGLYAPVGYDRDLLWRTARALEKRGLVTIERFQVRVKVHRGHGQCGYDQTIAVTEGKARFTAAGRAVL